MRSKPTAKPSTATKGPRYRFITEALRRQLTEGSLAPGARLPTLHELAGQFKVSTTTVRNAIRVLEREGSVYHVPAVGSFVRPSYPARAVAEKTTISLATLNISSPFELGIARGIEQGCQERGWGLQIYDARLNPVLEGSNLDRLARSSAHGAIITPMCDADTIERLFRMKLSGFPMVLLDRTIHGLKVDTVESDHETGAYVATQCLLEHGHRTVLMITAESEISSIRARMRGYERALIDHGLEPRREWKLFVQLEACERGEAEGRRWLHGYEALRPVLDRLEPPFGVFAMDDYAGWGVYEACREKGLRIPEDVSVVCFDDSDISRSMVPPMSSVAQHTVEIGRTAVELLERRLKTSNAEAQHMLVKVDLIKRASVASPGANRPPKPASSEPAGSQVRSV